MDGPLYESVLSAFADYHEAFTYKFAPLPAGQHLARDSFGAPPRPQRRLNTAPRQAIERPYPV